MLFPVQRVFTLSLGWRWVALTSLPSQASGFCSFEEKVLDRFSLGHFKNWLTDSISVEKLLE